MDLLKKFFFTLRYLKPIQIYRRIWVSLARRFFRVGRLVPLSRRAHNLKERLNLDIDAFTFKFLNSERRYPKDAVEWGFSHFLSIKEEVFDKKATLRTEIGDDDLPEKLWRYHLNYFDFLSEENSPFDLKSQKFLVLDWIEKNSDDRYESWEPYPISKRIVNWLLWKRRMEARNELAPDFRELLFRSIYFQCRRLLIDLEYHISANHLLENFKAIFVVTADFLRCEGNRPEMKSVEEWFEFSVKGLTEQIEEQILNDGGHYELSPMYHSMVMHSLRLIIDTVETLRRDPPDLPVSWEKLTDLRKCSSESLDKMATWLRRLTHPDGKIALFNDSNFNGELAFQVAAVEDGDKEFCFLEKSGYFTRRWGAGNYFVMDCGNPSPSFQTGHSHCDSLSYELSIAGNRLVVDTGCGSYQSAEIRNYCRRTDAHNLPLIEGSEQNEIWGSFRMGRRSSVLSVVYDKGACSSATGLRKQSSTGDQSFFCDLKDYRGNIFSRKVAFHSDIIDFEDRLKSRSIDGEFQSLIHLSPETRIDKIESGKISLILGNSRVEIKSANQVTLKETFYYPEFGKCIPNKTMVFRGSESNDVKYSIIIKS